MAHKIRPYTVAFTALLIASAAQGGTVLNFSDASSDETPADMLRATMTFSVSDDNVTLLIENTTSGEDAFDIFSVYFNTTPDIESLLLAQEVDGWNFLQNQTAGGFGRFDFALQSTPGNNSAEVLPGTTLEFEFVADSDVSIDELDFVSEFSRIPPGNMPALGVVKFVHGPLDDSAFGAAVPEPTALTLLGACLAVTLLRKPGCRQRA
ncbi:MAG: hypothetical protein ACYTHJ_16720 [Planctomycetota bacterium]|jgi:hypothetical protein